MGMVMHLPWHGDVCTTDLLPSPFPQILLHICLSVCLSVCRAGVIRKTHVVESSFFDVPLLHSSLKTAKKSFLQLATDQVDKETQMNKYMACGNTDMLLQKFSSKNAMEKGEKWSGKHIARSGVANTWPEVELSGNNMVLLVVQFVRAFAFFISDASLV
jgi:hypothetical protein